MFITHLWLGTCGDINLFRCGVTSNKQEYSEYSPNGNLLPNTVTCEACKTHREYDIRCVIQDSIGRSDFDFRSTNWAEYARGHRIAGITMLVDLSVDPPNSRW